MDAGWICRYGHGTCLDGASVLMHVTHTHTICEGKDSVVVVVLVISDA